jgi:hypothetical protein
VRNGISWILGTGAQCSSCPANIRRIRPAIAASSSGGGEGAGRDLAGPPLRMAGPCGATAAIGAWNDFLLGFISRRLVLRWECHVENFFVMARLACIKISLRQIEDEC